MRILQTVFDIMDYGGIINYTENLAHGFATLGHECDVVMLRNTTRPFYRTRDTTVVVGNYRSKIASRAHVTEGWYGMPVYGYGDKRTRKDLRSLTSTYDLVIHQIPMPRWDPDGHWRRLFKVIDTPQISVAHDARFHSLYPHLIDIADHLTGVVVTHEAGWNAFRCAPVRRMYVGAPHRLHESRWSSYPAWRDRPARFASIHVWKAWKRMDLVLRALIELPERVENIIGGDGIEARYMRSKTKVRERYRGLWKRALKADMDYRGFLSPSEIRKIYQTSRVVVDFSYSDAHAALGNHINRSMLEAWDMGCVPLTVNESTDEKSTTIEGKTTIFRRGETHLGVSAHATPEELADAIHEAITLKPKRARDIVENGREALKKYFDHVQAARWFLALADPEEKRGGIYGRIATGTLTTTMQRRRDVFIEKMERRAQQRLLERA